MSDGTFLVAIMGQLEYVETLAEFGSCWHCKYEFVSGPDWKIVSGIEAGLTQISHVMRNGQKVIFNFPLAITFKSTNIYGWPQIVVSVYKGTKIEGYGRIHIPLQPGVHKIGIGLFKPRPSSLLGYVGSFFGYQPELLDPKMLATGSGVHLLQMESFGKVIVSANVVMQGVKSLGYDVGNKRER